MDDFCEEQWDDVMNASDRVNSMFTIPVDERSEVPMIFCMVGIYMYIYFSFHAQPCGHP